MLMTATDHGADGPLNGVIVIAVTLESFWRLSSVGL